MTVQTDTSEDKISAEEKYDLTETERVVWEMLGQDTGRHMLDSGDAYGRHHERNQNRDFKEEPVCQLDVSLHGSFHVSVSVFHYLTSFLEYDKEGDEEFQQFRKDSEGSDLAAMESYAERYMWKGLYGDGDPMTVNTYNGPCSLDQTIQFVYGERPRNEEAVLLLQIHNGADVRGGYTTPKLFRNVAYDAVSFLTAYTRIYAGCSNGHHWHTDDLYHWYAQGSTAGDYPNLDEFSDNSVSVEEASPGEKKEAMVYDSDNDKIHCPVCDLRDGGIEKDAGLLFFEVPLD